MRHTPTRGDNYGHARPWRSVRHRARAMSSFETGSRCFEPRHNGCCLAAGQAAIDHKARAVAIRGIIGGKEKDSIGDLLRCA